MCINSRMLKDLRYRRRLSSKLTFQQKREIQSCSLVFYFETAEVLVVR